MTFGLAVSGCGQVSYDFSPYDARYSDTEMLYERGYIVRDSGESMPYVPPPATPTRISGPSPAMPLAAQSSEVQVSIPQGDAAWIAQQARTDYTLVLIDDSKPSVVADVLLRLPKNAHVAQYRYVQNGTTRYKGLYGVFKTETAAQSAMMLLPAQFKAQAKIIQFGGL